MKDESKLIEAINITLIEILQKQLISLIRAMLTLKTTKLIDTKFFLGTYINNQQIRVEKNYLKKLASKQIIISIIILESKITWRLRQMC